MKKIFILLTLMVNLFTYNVTITGDGVRVWKNWTNRYVTAPDCLLAPGGEYKVVGQYDPWLYVEVLSGHQKGTSNYVWFERVSNDTIIKQGVTYRSEPRVAKETAIGVLFKGDKVKIIKRIINRYLIESNPTYSTCDFGKCWVWAEKTKETM